MTKAIVTEMLAGLFGVDSAWLAPVRARFADLQAKVEDESATVEDVILALESCAADLPELLTRENVAPFADELEKALGAAVIDGVGGVLKNRAGLAPHNLPALFNRGKFALPPDGWFHLVPRGEYPHAESGLMQVVDTAALAAMRNSFVASRLIDFDHFSYDPEKSSEAAGWVDAVQVRGDGLWGKVRLSDLGETALLNGRYRYLSPVWLRQDVQELGNGKVRPLRLDTAGLTNAPNMRGMAPLTNRNPLPENPADAQAARDQAANKEKAKQRMKSIASRLGLAPDASEEAILAALDKVLTAAGEAPKAKEDADKVKKENGELMNRINGLLGEQIDTELAAAGIKDEAKLTRLKPILTAMTNRESRLAFLGDIKPEAEARKPLTNRNAGKDPGSVEESDAAFTAEKAKAGRISNRAAALRKADPTISVAEGYRRAEQELTDENAK